VQSRGHPETWATRYEGPSAYALVDAYIQGSLEWHRKAAERAQALQRQAEEERTARLEAEAELQRAAAERAEEERARAVTERQQAEESARRLSRRSRIALRLVRNRRGCGGDRSLVVVAGGGAGSRDSRQ
jgi:pyruvate/2-oxoglutarate dehydrogenase complex dihydrolipoamide acyltransferase (E2) component